LKDEITTFSGKSLHTFAFLSSAKEPPIDETVDDIKTKMTFFVFPKPGFAFHIVLFLLCLLFPPN